MSANDNNDFKTKKEKSGSDQFPKPKPENCLKHFLQL